MMKKLLILLLYICVVSCTQESSIYNPVDEDNDAIIYTEGNLTVYVENMEVATRSGWEYDDYFSSSSIYHDDSKSERGRFNTCVISFNSDFLLEYYTDQITASYFDPPATDILASQTEFTAFPLGSGNPLTTGAHYFYVVCNISKEMFDEIVGWFNDKKGVLTKDEFETHVICYPIDTLVHKFDGWDQPERLHSSQRCMMTNIVSPSPDYMASKDQNSTGSYPSTNNVTTNIGKVFAKASLAYIPETEQDRRLTEVSYKVINLPKSIYFMPNIFNGRVETPHYDIDFTGDFETCYEDYFDPNYKLPTDDDNENWLVATTGKEQTNKTHVYCMENGNKIPLQGNSTFLLVKAKYNPVEWLNKDGSPGTASPDGTFWRIRRAGYYTAGYYNAKPDATVLGSGEAVEYPQGITYYPIWLQTEGKYEVRRNGFYKIALTQVFSAGAPSLKSVIDPLAPLEESIQPGSLTKSGTGNLPDITTSIQWQQGGI